MWAARYPGFEPYPCLTYTHITSQWTSPTSWSKDSRSMMTSLIGRSHNLGPFQSYVTHLLAISPANEQNDSRSHNLGWQLFRSYANMYLPLYLVSSDDSQLTDYRGPPNLLGLESPHTIESPEPTGESPGLWNIAPRIPSDAGRCRKTRVRKKLKRTRLLSQNNNCCELIRLGRGSTLSFQWPGSHRHHWQRQTKGP